MFIFVYILYKLLLLPRSREEEFKSIARIIVKQITLVIIDVINLVLQQLIMFRFQCCNELNMYR